MSTQAIAKKEDGQVTAPRRASEILAQRLGVDPRQMVDIVKAQCFKGQQPGSITNEQLAVFCSVAADLGLNPLVPGMMYAFPSKNGGIEPMLGPDGVFRLLSQREDVDGWEIEYHHGEAGELIAATATITRANGKSPFRYTAYLKEWMVAKNPNWQDRPHHMLGMRALKQGARYIIHGIPLDPEEREIVDAQATRVDDKPTTPALPPASRAEGMRATKPAPQAAIEDYEEPQRTKDLAGETE